MIDFKLYAITDSSCCKPVRLFDIIAELLDVGVRAIQLREKELSEIALGRLAKPIAERCKRYEARLFINTSVRVAIDVGAAGVHLPVSACSVEAIKAETYPLCVGCSVHNFAEAKKRASEGTDFVTYSPIYPTQSKPGYGPPVGTASLTKLVGRIPLPIFALGGVTPERIAECMDAGASGIAVMSGLIPPKGAAAQGLLYLNALHAVSEAEG